MTRLNGFSNGLVRLEVRRRSGEEDVGEIGMGRVGDLGEVIMTAVYISPLLFPLL